MKKYISFFLILMLISACNSVKRVAQGKQLLLNNRVYVDGKKKSILDDYLIQRPNTSVFGLPLSLYFYNWGNPKGSKTPAQWGRQNPRTYQFFKNFFSEKQSIGFAKTAIRINRWFLKGGEPPVIISNKKIKQTKNNLRAFYQTHGYFQSKVSSKIDTVADKKVVVNYFITKGKPLFLDSIQTDIKSKVVDSLYKREQKKSYLKPGTQYRDANFIKEAKRLTMLFRNHGIYHFSENYIGFYNIDTASVNHKTKVLLKISDRLVAQNDKYITKPLKIQKIAKVTVYPDYTYAQREQPYTHQTVDKGVTFLTHQKILYNTNYLIKSLFIRPNHIYSDSLRLLTRSYLKRLQNFKNIAIKYTELDDSQLAATIFLTPIEKYSLEIKNEFTRSNIRNFGISGKFSILNRNTFRGAELFKLSFVGSFFNTSREAGKIADFFNSWEMGANLSLVIPRFIAPFGLNKLMPRRMLPQTKFSIGTSLQKNIGLDKQLITASIGYKWQFNRRKKIQFELLNLQYVRNLNIDNYFTIYASEFSKLNSIAKVYNKNPNYNLPVGVDNFTKIVAFSNTVRADASFAQSNPKAYGDNLNISNRYDIITSNFLIPVTAYSITYNNKQNFEDLNFSSFKFRLANSGNIIGLLSKETNSYEQEKVFNIPIAQYFKTDIEYKKFWKNGYHSVLGFRAFFGLAISYNGSSIPFTKSYFAGGANDIRAWQTYNLGPGTTPPGLEYNIGNLKFLTSLEYRFDLIGNLKGALFVDAGNIWDTATRFAEDRARFNGFSSLKDLAVGSGFGIRYDFKFLIARLDLGFKTHEPYLQGNRWFRNFNFGNAVYNIGINYPF